MKYSIAKKAVQQLANTILLFKKLTVY